MENSIKSRIAGRQKKNEASPSNKSDSRPLSAAKGASRTSDQEKGISPGKKSSKASPKTSNRRLTSKRFLNLHGTANTLKKPDLGDFEDDELSNISSPKDDNSDTDNRTKELLAKWGDKRYQKKLKDNPSPKKRELKSKLLSTKPSTETDFVDNYVVIDSCEDSVSQTDESDPEITYASTPQSIIRNPDKTLLSSESIRQIIQQDIIEREKAKKVLSENFKKHEVELGQSTAHTYDASKEKKESPSGKSNQMANSLSHVSIYAKTNDAEKNNTDWKIKMEVKLEQDEEYFSKEPINVTIDLPLGTEKQQEAYSVAQNPLESQLLRKIRNLESNIREMRNEKQMGILAKLGNEKGGIGFNNEKATESHFSKSTPLVPVSVEQAAMTSQGSSKCHVSTNDGPLNTRKELIPSEKKRTIIDKSNLDRLKGIIKVAMKEQCKEYGLVRAEKNVVEDKSSKLEDNILSRDKESPESKVKIDSVEKIDCQKTNEATCVEKRNLNLEGVTNEEASVKKAVGADIELNIRNEGRLHATQVEMENKKVAGDKKTKDDLEGILTDPAEAQGIDPIDSIVQSKNKVSEDDCTAGTTIQNPGLDTHKIEQLDARQTEPNLSISNTGFGNEKLITEDEKCLDDGKQKIVDCDLEKGRSELTIGHESNKQDKGLGIKEREKSSRNENKTEDKGAVEVQDQAIVSLASRVSLDSTKVKTVIPDVSLSKKEFDEVMDSKGKKLIDARKKGKTQRFAFQRNPSKETFSPGKDDVIGGILGKSAILVSIDERGSKTDENREDSRNERVAIFKAQGIDPIDSIVQSKNKVNEDDCIAGTTIQNPGLDTHKIEQLDARQTEPNLSISNTGFGNEKLITEDEKCLDDGKQKIVDCDLEKGRSELTIGHESNKQEKGLGIKEREKSSRNENKTEDKGAVEVQDQAIQSLASRVSLDSTKVKTVIPDVSLSKKEFDEVMDSKGKKLIDARKKGKTQRFAFQRNPSKETFSPGKDDVIGGILGKSAILVSIDERGSKTDENREDSRNERVAIFKHTLFIVSSLIITMPL